MSSITIAVTGHRDMIESDTLIQEVYTFFDKIVSQYNEVTLLSALADGADRFVAKIFLEKEVGTLKVPMPFSQTRYMEDFDDASKKEFLTLLEEATEVFEVHRVSEYAYQDLGKYLVDNSDMLLALWDGTVNHKKGGTSDVVGYAKLLHHEVVSFACEREND